MKVAKASTLRRRLAKAKKAHKFSTQYVAKDSGISPSSLYSLENDKAKPHLATLTKLQDWLSGLESNDPAPARSGGSSEERKPLPSVATRKPLDAVRVILELDEISAEERIRLALLVI